MRNSRAFWGKWMQSSAKFQDVQADISVDNYTAVVKDHEDQKGITAFRRAGGAMEMAMVLDKGQPGETRHPL